MAKQSAPLIPLSAEDRDDIIQLVLTAEEPLTAAQLVKRGVFSRKVSEKEAAGILAEATDAGRIHSWPPKSTKGKPRSWGRDASTARRDAVLDATRDMEKPLTAREIARQIKTPIKLAEAEVRPVLEEQVQIGGLFSIPPATAKGQPRFWSRDAVEFGRMTLIQLLQKKGPQQEASLKRATTWMKVDQFQRLLQRLLASKELYRHPAVGKVKRESFGLEPPRPGLYLDDLGSQLRKINAALLSAEVAPEDIRRSIVQVIAAAGISLGERSALSEVPTRAPATVDLIALMQRIEPGAARGALVGASDLRRAAGMDKQAFDQAVLGLSRRGILSLHRHDFASSLTAADREQLVTDGSGNYYVGVAIRQNVG